ncbi:MAG: ribokinase, partial [Clostridia bacterium]|nr:ribokinase [Clostridia bacterium]
NEHEASDITDIEPCDDDTIKAAADALSKMGVKNSLITLGKRGCVLSADGKLYFGDSVDCGPVVDTTAAGDSFVAAFCTAISAGVPIKNVLEFANCTAGITVSRKGAQPSLPNLDEVIEVMNKKGYEVKYGNA